MAARVCLINPPNLNHIRADYSDLIEKGTGSYPPLGLLYLSSACESKGYDVCLIDCPAEGLNYSQAALRTKAYNPDVVGVTCLTFNLVDVINLLKELKAALPKIPLVIGGPHAAIFPEELLKFPFVDIVVCGEAEEVFPEIIARLMNKVSLRGLKGTGYKDGETIVLNSEIAFIEKLDSLAFPSRQALLAKYFSLMGEAGKSTIMMTSRGCPFSCIYCDRPAMGKRYRARSAEGVVAEIEECLNREFKEIMFFDDTFTLNRSRVLKICELIIEKRLRFRWSCRARVDTVDFELLSAMKKSGCCRISYGIESASASVLEKLKKGITLAQAKAAVAAAKACGIEVLTDFIIGCPGEDRQAVLKTIDFALSSAADYAQFTIMSLYPRTEIYQMALSTGLLKRDVWKDFAASPDCCFNTPIWPGQLSQKELEGLLTLAYRRFYQRPAYIWGRIKKIKSPREMFLKAKAGWKALTLKRALENHADANKREFGDE